MLVAPPVGAGDPQQLEVPEESAGVRYVGSSTQVDEPVVADEGRPVLGLSRWILVGADPPRLGHRHGIVGFPVDDLEFEGMVGEHRPGALVVEFVAHEGLRLGDDGTHPLLDPLEVVRGEGSRLAVRAGRKLEVVVEPVFHRRADRERRSGEQVQNRLGEYVGGGMANGVETFRARRGADGDLVAVLQTPSSGPAGCR